MYNLTISEKRIGIVLMAAITCIATIIVRIPTPVGGYVNLGDGFALACGMILGPLSGSIAAGAGSALADLINGYSSIAPATFVIKAFMATGASICLKLLAGRSRSGAYNYVNTAIAAATGELIMIAGYYIYDAAYAIYSNNRLNRNILMQALRNSSLKLPFEFLQASIGIAVAIIITPILAKLIFRGK
jgi:uncharacterized membrane protein